MNKSELKYWQANDEFIEREKKNPDVTAILTCGSLTKGEIDQNSDIDILIVLDTKCDYRERGNTWVNGIEIEYFKNPPQQIRSYLKKETKSPHTAHMLANGKLMYKKSNEVDALILEAKKIIQKGPDSINEIALELALYFLDDKLKDADDAIIRDDEFGVHLLKFDLINLSIDTFCKINRIWRAKDKNLKQQLMEVNPDFADLIESAMTSNWTQKSIKTFKSGLTRYLGGQRKKEWRLRSSLDL